MKNTIIIFDMDGTILNTLEDLTQNIVVKNQNIKFVNDHLQVDASGNAGIDKDSSIPQSVLHTDFLSDVSSDADSVSYTLNGGKNKDKLHGDAYYGLYYIDKSTNVITFSDNDEDYSFFKQVLEGSVVPMPENCIIYATTNRRHVIKETFSERSGDELHAADARDENMSLADRFGLYITFLSPDKKEFSEIVYQLAEDAGIHIDRAKLDMLAERYALKKCGRSPRTAKQFVDILKSRIELDMDIEKI